MKTIRKSVFETNSSSTHSISIVEENVIDEEDLRLLKSECQDGILTIGYEDFGWEVDEHYDILTKANYCAADQEYNEENLEMLKEVIKEVTGLKVFISEEMGYIDHQSSGTSNACFYSKETLKNFIFNPNSYISTSNDNM